MNQISPLNRRGFLATVTSTASCTPASRGSSVACTAACSVSDGVRTVIPPARIAARCAPRAITVTSCPLPASRAARCPPMAPAP